ncbi:hypothetical protein, partial [Enterobacter asburiae]
CCSEVSISPLFRWPNSVNHFKPCLPWQATRRGGIVGQYSVSVLLKQIIAGIEMIIEIEERIELLQGE